MLEHRHFGLDVPQRVVNKFWDYVAKNRIPPGKKLEQFLWRSQELCLDPDVRQALCYELKLKEPKDVWARLSRCSDSFSLVLIGEGQRLVEICSYRSIRQMVKAWLHYCREHNPDFTRESWRYKEVFKHKRSVKIGGGLMRGEETPRDRWKNK